MFSERIFIRNAYSGHILWAYLRTVLSFSESYLFQVKHVINPIMTNDCSLGYSLVICFEKFFRFFNFGVLFANNVYP
jgi:hypothetical protein